MNRLTFLMIVIMFPASVWAEDNPSSTATGISRTMNPALSVNGLFLAQWNRDTPTAEENFVKLQETEIQFTAAVDPYWSADLILGFDPGHGEEGDEHSGSGLETDVEVASLRSSVMPAGLGLMIGKFIMAFGKHPQLHPHQYPFTRAPLAQSSFLGEHGLSEVGVQVDWTVPLPWWSEIFVYGVNGDSEIFDADDADPVFGTRWSNLWDVSAGGTFELGGSYLNGPAALHETGSGDLDLLGLDLTWKWVSTTRSQGPAAEASFELIKPDAQNGEGNPLGWFAYAQTRFKRNFWFGLGFGRTYDTQPDHGHAEELEPGLSDWNEVKAALTWAPSEFSSLRAEVWNVEEIDGEDSDLRFSLQWNFTIGSHPAHLY